MLINRESFFQGHRREFGPLNQGQVNALNKLLDFFEGDDYKHPLQLMAYMMATTHWETARTFEPVKEAFWLSEGWRERNLRYFPYYARGYVGLTWEDNYIRAGNEFGINLVDHPDRAMEPAIAYNALTVGMRKGWYGHSVLDHITPEKTDYYNARRSVNITDKAAEIAGVARSYEEILRDAGYSHGWAGDEVGKPKLPNITAANAAETIERTQVLVGVEPDGVLGSLTRAAMAEYEGDAPLEG